MASSTSSNASAIGSFEPSISVKRKSNDIGWEYGVIDNSVKSMDKIRCKLCAKVMSGGVYRIKEHIGVIPGNVTKCFVATPEDQKKYRDAINLGKMKKKTKKVAECNIRAEVHIDEMVDTDELQEFFGAEKPPHSLGPMDKFSIAINPGSSSSSGKSQQQQSVIDAFAKERLIRLKTYICRWAYEASIPFNAFEKDSFKMMLEAIGQYGPGAEPPNRYEMGEIFLKKEVYRVWESLKTHKAEWKRNGCSIIMDRKMMSIINLYVNSSLGTVFLSSKECSLDAYTSECIFKYVEHGIQQVGAENVIQVVTDNATNNMGVAKLLKDKMPTVFWTSCATHSINLMLESIASLPRYKKVLDQAKALTIFIYSHQKTLTLMRSFTKKGDIVRPGVTRFASAFLTLQSLADKKVELRAMFTSNEWDECKFAKTIKGKNAHSTMLSIDFWQGVSACLKVFAPLVRVFRVVDCDKKPSMGFVYGELMRTKEDIKIAMNNVQRNYEPIMGIIDANMKNRLDTPIHLMAYLLNPYYHYKDPQLHLDEVISTGVLDFLNIYFFDNIDMQNKIISEELPKYKKKEGVFGKPIAAKVCKRNYEKFDPVNWWSIFGSGTPILRRIAMKILSLTSSSSGCGRNWSTFDGIHTKKRNRLNSTQLNNLMFVHFNATLMNKHKEEQNVEKLLASDTSLAQDWIVDNLENDELETGSGRQAISDAMKADKASRPQRSNRLRELEDSFESEETA